MPADNCNSLLEGRACAVPELSPVQARPLSNGQASGRHVGGRRGHLARFVAKRRWQQGIFRLCYAS